MAQTSNGVTSDMRTDSRVHDGDTGASFPGPQTHENQWYNQDFNGYRVREDVLRVKRRVRIICVGAGAAGLTIAAKAGTFLTNVELQIYETASDVGGTWLVNDYPGCTCDIPSHSYQFAWARNPTWSSFYASAPEILQYMKDTASLFGLRRYIKFNHRVSSAVWDEESGVWNVKIQAPDGSLFQDKCEILADGSGILSDWKYPDISGINEFKGKLMHTARYDHSYDMTNKTVAVIGGGSSAVQLVPELQKVAKKVIPFLRSPTWITAGFGAAFAGPGGTNFQYSEEQIAEFVKDPSSFDRYCRSLEGELNKRFNLMHLNSVEQLDSRQSVSETMTHKLQGKPELVESLVPKFGLGCRRMTPGPEYLRSLTKSNVEVVIESVAAFDRDGLVDGTGTHRKVDAIVCATGFNTSFNPSFEVIGRGGRELKKEFGDFPIGYLGVMAEGFPNYFFLVGPNGPASHGSYLPILDWHCRYIFQMVNKLQEEDIKCFDPKPEVIRELYDHTHELFKRLVWSSACRSWFKNGKEHGPVTAVYAGSRLHYFEVMKAPRFEDFKINYRTANRFTFFGNGYTANEISPTGNPVWYLEDEFVRTAPKVLDPDL